MSVKNLNSDHTTRNKIIFGDSQTENWSGGVRHFSELNLDQLKSLLENNFIDPDDCQNLSPTVHEFFKFMEQHPGVKAHGYAVSHCRNDYRVSLEGLSYHGIVDTNLMMDFSYLCRQADEFVMNTDELYSWWN
jgi:hypothetical protein